MKIRLILAGAMFLGSGAFSWAHDVDPGIVINPPQKRKNATLKQLLRNYEQLRLSSLRLYKPNSPEVRDIEASIRDIRRMIQRESSPQRNESPVLKRAIAQLEHKRRELLRKPKTEKNQTQLFALNAQLQALRATQRASPARPTPTPQFQLLSP